MCVIAAKYFPDYGWVGVKNRDRTYQPTILIRKSHKNNIDRLYIWDENTRYTEGLNENGISILNASFGRSTAYDKGKKDDEESEIHAEGDDPDYYSKDGRIIRTALLEKTIDDAIGTLVAKELTGCCLIFNREQCYVLEADYINHKYQYKVAEVPKDKYIVRTNHGILLHKAGFQRGSKHPNLEYKRVSSELRRYIVDRLMKFVRKPNEMLELLTYHRSRNKQYNPFRLDFEKGNVRTTGQLLIVPKYRTLFYRPIKSNIQYDANKLNGNGSKLKFKMLTTKDLDLDSDK